MYAMFYNCKHLTSLDLTHFNTSKVIYMFDMFYNCNELNSLDLSSFDISKVTDMRGMFKYCDNLKTLNIKNIKTNENNEQLLNFLQEIKNIQNIIINPNNNILLYRKLKEVKYKLFQKGIEKSLIEDYFSENYEELYNEIFINPEKYYNKWLEYVEFEKSTKGINAEWMMTTV